MKNYTLITARANRLPGLVQTKIEAGWLPLGGVASYEVGDAATGYRVLFAQAMMKDDQPTPKRVLTQEEHLLREIHRLHAKSGQLNGHTRRWQRHD